MKCPFIAEFLNDWTSICKHCLTLPETPSYLYRILAARPVLTSYHEIWAISMFDTADSKEKAALPSQFRTNLSILHYPIRRILEKFSVVIFRYNQVDYIVSF